MKKRIIFFISCLGILPFCFSQDIDSILINSETNFSDSIAKYNQQQKLLKLSHDAYNKGIQFFELNNFSDAINSFNEAIGMDSSFVPAYFNRGVCYSQISDYENPEKKIISILDQYIKPAILLDGGEIEFNSLKNGIALKLTNGQGMCEP